MDNIKKEFRKRGFLYKLIASGEKAVIYEQYSGDEIVSHEVHKLYFRKSSQIDGRVLSVTNRFPGNEDFGKWAWSIKERDRAFQKFNNLEEKQK